eukprot:1149387-Pelagomonas_calceolata.AAC.1
MHLCRGTACTQSGAPRLAAAGQQGDWNGSGKRLAEAKMAMDFGLEGSTPIWGRMARSTGSIWNGSPMVGSSWASSVTEGSGCTFRAKYET